MWLEDSSHPYGRALVQFVAALLACISARCVSLSMKKQFFVSQIVIFSNRRGGATGARVTLPSLHAATPGGLGGKCRCLVCGNA